MKIHNCRNYEFSIENVIPKIERLVSSGVLVAMTTQCIYGRVNPHVYSNLREVSSRGVVYCEDMLSETAYVKMMWVLGKGLSPEESGRLMLESVAGEITASTRIEDGAGGFLWMYSRTWSLEMIKTLT